MVEEVRDYITTRLELLKLEILDRVSSLLGLLCALLIVTFLAITVFIFLGFAMVYALCEVLPMWAASLIVAATFLLILVLLIVCRRVLFILPIKDAMSRIMFHDGMSHSQYEVEMERLRHKQEIQELKLQNLLSPVSIISYIIPVIKEWFTKKKA